MIYNIMIIVNIRVISSSVIAGANLNIGYTMVI